MGEDYQIINSEKPDWGTIGGAISQYNREHAGDDGSRTICYLLMSPDQEVVGGVIGVVYWDWFSLDLMWVKEELRGTGYGTRLLKLAEEKARENGARHVHVDTFSFQAPGFYEKHGYRVFGELKDFPSGHQRYYLRKEL